MNARVQLFRADGTLLMDERIVGIEFGRPHIMSVPWPNEPIIDNGMQVFAVRLQASVNPVRATNP